MSQRGQGRLGGLLILQYLQCMRPSEAIGLFGEHLVEAQPAPPPVGWLPAAASTPRPPWSVPSLPMPASSGLEALATRCALAPAESVTPDSFLAAVLGEELAALPSVETLTGQDWRWWLMGMDTLVALP